MRKHQRTLPFDGKREQDRIATIERLFGDDKRVQTAARFFDDQGEREAVAIATQKAQHPKPRKN